MKREKLIYFDNFERLTTPVINPPDGCKNLQGNGIILTMKSQDGKETYKCTINEAVLEMIKEGFLLP